MTEKYAILIEHSETLSQLEKIHENMLDDYSDLSIRKKEEKASAVDKVKDYIDMYFSENISIEEIARKLYVHPSHLMRAFKKEHGITISHYRNKKRIKEAKDLLTQTKLSMTEIAIIIGFNTPQYFSTIFLKEEGLTPKEYKQQYTN
ncbi:YesN/AraC family two-component response regulator [Evansella vedderi]|uniref:YesN/AraC family two-component response regulator n=1 Tax=Evansella vedderi TaxID=38282 RepID=A0ABT9ZZR0_9BACI|nr:AraC family transcriptional regulator [Evansella vedderi]MDQ0256717.1 YesN/AraC family two-component response regulator [Evansella vedderi]